MNLFFRYILFFVVFFGVLKITHAQDVPFKSKYFKDKKKQFREALKELHLADEIIETEKDYDKALNHYQRAYRFHASSVNLNFKIAQCYILGDRTEPTEAKPYLEKAIELDSLKRVEVFYYLGKVHQSSKNWDAAIINYKKYKALCSKDEVEDCSTLAQVEKNIAQCYFAKNTSSKEKKRVLIENLGRRINSPYPEYGAVFTPDMQRMYFTSRRNKTTGFDVDIDLHYYEDIYEARKTEQSWNRVKNLGAPINTNGHESILSISPDGKKMLLYRGSNNGDIYFSEKKGRDWSEPVAMAKPINSKYKETAACFAENGKTIYLVSDRTGSLGGLDIFKSEYKKGKGWTEPKNLGAPINTIYNEVAVFIDCSNVHLYYSSDNEQSIGGYDIFKATNKNGSWSDIENMGTPINTPYDDLYFVTDSSEKIAYYTTRHADTEGSSDIYKATFLSPEKPVNLMASNFEMLLPQPNVSAWLIELMDQEENQNKEYVFKGMVRTKDGNSAEVLISLEDPIQQMLIRKDSTYHKGSFSYSLNASTDYRMLIQAKGYMPITKNLRLKANTSEVFILEPVKKGEKLVFEDIYFATGSKELSADSESSLQQLLSFLQQNMSIKVKLIGHTDNIGSKIKNLELSKQRAKSVRDWLISQGISQNRLIYTGKGDAEPVGNNDTVQGRQKNRRTEVEII